MKEPSISVLSTDSRFLQVFVDNLAQYFPFQHICGVDRLAKLFGGLSIDHQPQLIFVDFSKPNLLSRIHLFKLYQSFPEAELVVILEEENPDRIFEFIQAGASGYLLKGNWKEALPTLLENIADQKALISPTVSRYLIDRFKHEKDMVYN
jgi:DNA-binding NarL/FixJ family response regulator